MPRAGGRNVACPILMLYLLVRFHMCQVCMTGQHVNLLCSAVWCWKVLLLPGDPSASPSHLTPDRMMAGSHALFCRQGGLPFLEWRAVEGEMLKTLCHSYGPPSAPLPDALGGWVCKAVLF